MALFKKKKEKEEIKKTEPQPVKKEEKVTKAVAKEKASKTAKDLTGKSSKAVVRAYQIVKEPHITEKATFLNQQNKYVFKVYPSANKKEIKKAVETLYGVKVVKVHILHSAPKKRRLGRWDGWKNGLKRGYKKAIVTLKEGDKIEIVPG